TDMASVLSSYLISNGAADPRYQSKDQQKKDASRTEGPNRPKRSAAGSRRPHLRRRSPGRLTERRRKARAHVRVATGSGLHVRRQAMPNLQMGKRRRRLRPTAKPV